MTQTFVLFIFLLFVFVSSNIKSVLEKQMMSMIVKTSLSDILKFYLHMELNSIFLLRIEFLTEPTQY